VRFARFNHLLARLDNMLQFDCAFVIQNFDRGALEQVVDNPRLSLRLFPDIIQRFLRDFLSRFGGTPGKKPGLSRLKKTLNEYFLKQ
jgi:hypothetical protein